MASKLTIWNRALQKLGAKRVASETEQSPSARACLLAYPSIRQSELRKNVWNFAIKRASLSVDSPAPDWGRQSSFTLPADWLRLAESYPEDLTNDVNLVGVSVAFTATFTGQKDWVIEGKKVLTNDTAPLHIRYVADIEDVSQWDPIFCEVVSTAMAYEMCEELTQSNTKKTDLAAAYKYGISEARSADSIEVAPADPPPDTWLAARS